MRRWCFFYCFLLTSIAVVSANEREKRSIGYIKNLIGSTLFGTSTTHVVYARLIARNDTHQLLSIPGQNYNILIQVSNNTKSDKEEKEKSKVNRTVTPEIAILGTYLGNKTKADIAIKMAKSLIKTGVLTENLLQKVVIETKEKIMLPLDIYTQERDPVFIYPPKRVNAPVAVFPVEVPPLEVAITPVQNQFSYKQSDIKYEGKDIIVMRTTKEPVPVPEFIKMRLQEVGVNGGTPFMRLPVAVEYLAPVNNVPIPYLYRRPDVATPEFVSAVPNPVLNMHIERKPILFSQPIPLDAVKILPSNNGHLNTNLGKHVQSDSNSIKIHGNKDSFTKNDKNQNVRNILNPYVANGQIVSNYYYKQMDPNNPGQYTEIRIENIHNANLQEKETQKVTPAKDFVYVPPKNVNIPSPVGSNSQAIATSTISANKSENDHVYTSKTPVVSAPSIICKTSQSESLKSNPMVAVTKEANAVIEEGTSVEGKSTEESRRGDIPGPIH